MKEEVKWFLSDSARVAIDEHNIIQAIQPDSFSSSTTLSETIENYINDQIEYFRKENHISKKAWDKRGVITKQTQYLEKLEYILSYKKLGKQCTHKIAFSYQIAKCLYR